MTADVELQIIMPAKSSEPLCDMLVEITKAIDAFDEDRVAHGFLGGEHGYGGHWDSPVFTMRPFYWGDCDCGADVRGDAWHKANPHKRDCFISERDRRWAAYDEKVEWAKIEAAAYPGGNDFFAGWDNHVEQDGPFTFTMSTPRKDPAMLIYNAAYKKRDKAQERIIAKLYDDFGLPRSPYQWQCTCGVDELGKAYFATEGHYPTCALELPNFRHHASGFEARWYKYIGRDNETVNMPADLTAVFRDCLADIAASVDTLPKGRDAEQGSVRSKGSAVAATGGETPKVKP